MRSAIAIGALFAFAALLGGCAAREDQDPLIAIDDDEIAAIQVARNSPEMHRYLLAHPAVPGESASWFVYGDEYYPTTPNGYYRFRHPYCKDEYIVWVVPLSKTTSTSPVTDLIGPTVIANVRNQSARVLPIEEQFATPAPQPTPCMDGSLPRAKSEDEK